VYLLNKKKYKMQKFVVIGIHRTGTTLLVTLLDSHPEITCMGEAFLDVDRYIGPEMPSFRRYLNRSFPDIQISPGMEKTVIYNFLDCLYNTAARAVGFKLMQSDFEAYPAILNFLQDRNIKIIHIHRKNLLKIYVSRLKARTSGIYDSRHPKYVKNEYLHRKTHVPVDTLKKRLDFLSMQFKALKRIILSLKVDFLTIKYEDLDRNREKEMQKILSFLYLDTTIQLNTPLQKVSHNRLEKRIENYGEVVEELENTEYSIFLDD
jgi:LPS sulfotransferase NodH